MGRYDCDVTLQMMMDVDTSSVTTNVNQCTLLQLEMRGIWKENIIKTSLTEYREVPPPDVIVWLNGPRTFNSLLKLVKNSTHIPRHLPQHSRQKVKMQLIVTYLMEKSEFASNEICTKYVIFYYLPINAVGGVTTLCASEWRHVTTPKPFDSFLSFTPPPVNYPLLKLRCQQL